VGTHDTTVSADCPLYFFTLSMGVISIVSHKARRGVCRLGVPCAPIAPALSALFSSPVPSDTPASTTPLFTQSYASALETARSTSALKLRTVVTMPAIKEASDPVIRTASPAPLAQDFARQQVSKQQRSNFHSSSISPLLATMAPPAVNKTNLHPGGLKYVSSSLPRTCFEKQRLTFPP
jgi:phosphoenolpyruvate carboxykinase (ATP)